MSTDQYGRPWRDLDTVDDIVSHVVRYHFYGSGDYDTVVRMRSRRYNPQVEDWLESPVMTARQLKTTIRTFKKLMPKLGKRQYHYFNYPGFHYVVHGIDQLSQTNRKLTIAHTYRNVITKITFKAVDLYRLLYYKLMWKVSDCSYSVSYREVSGNIIELIKDHKVLTFDYMEHYKKNCRGGLNVHLLSDFTLDIVTRSHLQPYELKHLEKFKQLPLELIDLIYEY